MVFTKLIAKCLNGKHLDADVLQVSGIKSTAEKTLFPNVASTPAVPSEQLLQEHVSRKTMLHAQIIRNYVENNNFTYL